MKILLILILMSIYGNAMEPVWINAGSTVDDFISEVQENEGTSMATHQLSLFQSKNKEHSYLMSKVEFWSQSKVDAKKFNKELFDLQSSTVFSASNRIVLFEYLKKRIDHDPLSFAHLCRYYANDPYLKSREPFFESSCHFQRLSFKELNSQVLFFDYVLMDGNIIDLKLSPYFYTAGSDHQFIFVSSRYKTKELTGSAQKLKHEPIALEPWVEGKCNKGKITDSDVSIPVKIYFSKDCIQDQEAPSATKLFLVENRYYIYTGILLTLAAAYVNSQYQLGVTLH